MSNQMKHIEYHLSFPWLVEFGHPGQQRLSRWRENTGKIHSYPALVWHISISCPCLTYFHWFSIADIFIYFTVMLLIIYHFHIDDWLWHCHYFWSIFISFCGLVIFNGSQFFSGRVHPWFLGGSTIAQYKYQYIWLVNDKWGSSKCNPV